MMRDLRRLFYESIAAAKLEDALPFFKLARVIRLLPIEKMPASIRNAPNKYAAG
jgi:hypothetical protein